MAKRKSFASVSMQDDKPFDFVRTVFEGVIAGGAAGGVVETALYPYDTIKTSLQTAGACGGIAASLVRVPTEVVKQRMQTGQFTSASAAVRLIAAKEGFKGLYAGIGPRVLWIGIGGSIFFGVFERTMRLLAQGRPTVGEDTKQD